jgi:hypothetical protein
MAKKTNNLPDPYIRQKSMFIGKHEVVEGDTIKVTGKHGQAFRFASLTTNPKTDKTWVDCFEIQKGIVGAYRAFYPEDIKPVRTVKKRVKRNRDSATP